jgi:ferritin-like metal-binding protein YciE
MADKELLISWLRDAHAMETALIPVLEQHAKDASGNRMVAQRIALHAEQTRRHAELVRGCLEQLNVSESMIKSGASNVLGWAHAYSTKMFSDENVKNGLTDYAVEHFELACYKALEHAAMTIGDTRIAETCRMIQQDEREMADFLAEQLPAIVREAMTRPAAATGSPPRNR